MAQVLNDKEENKITDVVIGAAIEVHRVLGPGLLESTYETCLAFELKSRGLEVVTQKVLPVRYKGLELEDHYRVDMIVNQKVIIEIKSVSAILPVHEAQLLTYLRLSNLRVGLVLNFNVAMLKQGISRISND